MKITSIAATLGAAILLAGSPALASAADNQSAPIRLDNVQVEQSYGPQNDFNPGLVTVSFTNENDSPATDIIFALEANGRIIDRFEDVGSYAKGESVRHSFQDIQDNNNQQVAVEKVTFADGSVWNNPELALAPAIAAPAPAQLSDASLYPLVIGSF